MAGYLPLPGGEKSVQSSTRCRPCCVAFASALKKLLTWLGVVCAIGLVIWGMITNNVFWWNVGITVFILPIVLNLKSVLKSCWSAFKFVTLPLGGLYLVYISCTFASWTSKHSVTSALSLDPNPVTCPSTSKAMTVRFDSGQLEYFGWPLRLNWLFHPYNIVHGNCFECGIILLACFIFALVRKPLQRFVLTWLIKVLWVLHTVISFFLRGLSIFMFVIAFCLLCSGVCQGVPEISIDPTITAQWPTCRGNDMWLPKDVFAFIFDQPPISLLPFSNGMHRLVACTLCLLQCGLLRSGLYVLRLCTDTHSKLDGHETFSSVGTGSGGLTIFEFQEHINDVQKALTHQKEQTSDLEDKIAEAHRWAQRQIETMEVRDMRLVAGEMQSLQQALCDKFAKLREVEANKWNYVQNIVSLDDPEPVVAKGVTWLNRALESLQQTLQGKLDRAIKEEAKEESLKTFAQDFGKDPASQQNPQEDEERIHEAIEHYARRNSNALYLHEALEFSAVFVHIERQTQKEKLRLMETTFMDMDPANKNKNPLFMNLQRRHWVQLFENLSKTDNQLSKYQMLGKKISALGGAIGAVLILWVMHFKHEMPPQVIAGFESKLPNSLPQCVKLSIFWVMAAIPGIGIAWCIGGKKGQQAGTPYEALTNFAYGASACIAAYIGVVRTVKYLV